MKTRRLIWLALLVLVACVTPPPWFKGCRATTGDGWTECPYFVDDTKPVTMGENVITFYGTAYYSPGDFSRKVARPLVFYNTPVRFGPHCDLTIKEVEP
jgi:hypothetical protein